MINMPAIAHLSRSHLIAMATLLLLALAAGKVYAKAGKFYFVYGIVKVESADGQTRIARKGDGVEQGDTIHTGSRGSAQVFLQDGGLLAVRPNTNLRITEFRYAKKKKEDRTFLSLLKGSFRSITGLIAKRNHKSYRVSTPTATIGIRGSDADIGFRETDQLTGVRTFDGSHTLTAKDHQGVLATLVTEPGQIGIHLPGAAPLYSNFFPFETPAPRTGGKRPPPPQGQRQGQGQGQQIRRPANGQHSGPGPAPINDVIKPPIPPPMMAKTAGSNTHLQFTNEAPVGSGAIGSDMWVDTFGNISTGNGGMMVDGSPGKGLLLGPSNQVLAIADYDAATGNGFNFIAASGNLAVHQGYSIPKPGGTAAVGTWGVWKGPFVVIDHGSAKNTISGFHYATTNRLTKVSELASLNGTGFIYNKIGGIATNEAGALANSYTVSATGIFKSPALNLGPININVTANFPVGSNNWTGNYNGTIKNLINPNGPGLGLSGGSCSGCSAPMGNTSGVFTGARAEGLLLGIGMADSTKGKAMNGSAVLKR
ncbi:MAG: FecR domain-containing protein [Gammaproteobacteria bacterium]|nr:FecR domain-containing protein [Gammaproteobacteria bacterium]